MLCHKCNAEIADYSKFCSFCGEPVGNDDKKIAITEASEVEKNKAVKEDTEQKDISVNTNELHAMLSKKNIRNSKRFYLLLILLAVIGSAVLLLQYICFHDWIPATCSTVETCSKCGETKDSELLPHTWLEATCTEPSRCSQCGEVRGGVKSHTINNMGVCAICGKVMGKELTLANFEEYLSFSLSYSDIVSTVRRRIAYDKNGVIFHPTEIRVDGVNIFALPKANATFKDVIIYGNVVDSYSDLISPYAVHEDNSSKMTFKIMLNSNGAISKIEFDKNNASYDSFSSGSIYFLLSPNPSKFFDHNLSPYFNVTGISGKVAVNL